MLSMLRAGLLLALLTPAPPKIRHVFLVVLENQAYRVTFGRRTPAPYLARVLPKRGALLRNYYGIGHMSLDNYVALVSGQAPNEQTQLDCVTYSEFQLASPWLDAHGQALGSGCVYPSMVRTIGDQIDSAGLRWRAYVEDLGNDPAREGRGCAHPAIGAPDPTETAPPSVRDQYVAWHNPFGQPRPPGGLGAGGGRVGAVMLSPFIRPGTVSLRPYNHYALLRSVEDMLGLVHLGYAAEPELRALGADVFDSR